MIRYGHTPVCDLRHVTSVEIAKEIEAVDSVAVLILPKDVGPEVMNAIGQIQKYSVAMTIYLNQDEKVTVMNGVCEVGDSDLDEPGALVANGIVIFKKLTKKPQMSVAMNGVAVVHDDSEFVPSFLQFNGMQYKAPKFTNIRVVPESIEIDAATVDYMEVGTALVCGSEMKIKEDVTSEMLKAKDVTFIAGEKISCHENNAGYVKMNSIAGDTIDVIVNFDS